MIAIKGGKVFLKGSFEDGYTILIKDGVIAEIGKDLHISEEYECIEAMNKYILPGLIDAHTHIGLGEEIYRVEGDDVNEMSDPITSQLQAIDGVNFADIAFQDALKGGVTTSLCMPGSANIIGGQAVLLKMQADQVSQMVYKNPWGLKAALGENPKRVYMDLKKTPQTRMASASLLREALYLASKTIDKDDVDPKDKFKHMSIYKVLKREMPLLVHAHRADDIFTALRIKDEFNIDLVIQHGTEAFLIADELVKRDVSVCLGPLLVNRAKVEMKEVALSSANKLAQAGVKFCLITDHPVIPIEHLRVCAALAVREGLDENLAIQALTNIPAEILKIDKETGSLEKGKSADIVIFDAHPFDFRSKVHTVMVNGRFWRGFLE